MGVSQEGVHLLHFALLVQREIEDDCDLLLERVLETTCFFVTELAEEHDVVGGVGLDVFGEVEAIQVRHSLEPCKVFIRATSCTNVLAVLEIEIGAVELLKPIELAFLLVFVLHEVELHGQGIFTDHSAVAMLNVPLGFFLITIEEPVPVHGQNLAVIVFHLVHLSQPTHFFLRGSCVFDL